MLFSLQLASSHLLQVALKKNIEGIPSRLYIYDACAYTSNCLVRFVVSAAAAVASRVEAEYIQCDSLDPPILFLLILHYSTKHNHFPIALYSVRQMKCEFFQSHNTGPRRHFRNLSMKSEL